MTGSRPVAVLVCALILVCGACDWSAEKYAPRQEKQFARAYLDSVRAGNIEAARRHLHPTLDTPDCDAKLLAIAQSFPSGKLIEAVMNRQSIGGADFKEIDDDLVIKPYELIDLIDEVQKALRDPND